MSNNKESSSSKNFLFGTLFAVAAGAGYAVYSYYKQKTTEAPLESECGANDEDYTYRYGPATSSDTHPKQLESKTDECQQLEKCSICMENLVPRTKIFSVLPCGHTFHEECIQNWLQLHKWCPNCRLNVAE